MEQDIEVYKRADRVIEECKVPESLYHEQEGKEVQ